MLSLSQKDRLNYLKNKDNPFEYDPVYLDIYNREKSYREIKEFEYLYDVTDQLLIYRSTLTIKNVIYAPKKQDNVEIPYKEVFKIIEDIFGGFTENVFICGGSALSYYFFKNCDILLHSKDIDLFIAQREHYPINILDIREILLKINNKGIEMTESEGAISFKIEGIKFQIIKRLYSSPSEIIHGFDIDCSCILVTIDTKRIYITERCNFALTNQLNTINFERLSPSYEHRLFKYYLRGFGIWVPFYDYFMDNFVTDFRNYPKLTGSLVLYYRLLKYKENFKIKDISDYDNNPKSLFPMTSIMIEKVIFMKTDPSEQANNTFTRTVHDDPKNWYITNSFETYKIPLLPLNRTEVYEIEPSTKLNSVREAFFPYHYTRKEDYNGAMIRDFLNQFKNMYLVGKYTLSLFNSFKSNMNEFEFAAIDSKMLSEKDIHKMINKFISLLNKVFSKRFSKIDYSEIENVYNPTLFKYKAEKQFPIFEFFFKNILVKIHLTGYRNITNILDSQENQFRLVYNGKFYTDQLGEYHIFNRYTEKFTAENKKLLFATLDLDIQDKIDNIKIRFIGQSYKLYGDPRKIKNLYGPTTLTFFKNFGDNNGRRLLILGEYHSNEGIDDDDFDPQSFEVNMWLYYLSKINYECLDIYLEYNDSRAIKYDNFKKVKFDDYTEPIMSIANTFKDCNSDNTECFSSSVRYHKIDLRTISSKIKTPIKNIIQDINWNGKKKEYEQNLINLEIFGNKKTDGNINSYIIFRYCSGWSHIIGDNKQLLKDKKVFEKAFSILSKGTEHNLNGSDEYYKAYLKKIQKAFIKAPDVDFNLFFNTLYSCYNDDRLFDILVTVNMDVYCLIRYLQTFDKLERGPLNCQAPEFNKSKNTIIHAGDYHSQIYAKFIEKWFNITPDLVIKQPHNTQKIEFDEEFDFFG